MKKLLALLLLSPLVISEDMIIKCEGESCINETPSYIPTFKVNPFYPSKALNKNLSGYVVTSFTIRKNGSVKNIKAIEGFCSTHKPEYGEFKELINPTLKLTKEQMVEISEQANSFVHSKHRPWMYDDTFAEYLNLVNEMIISKQKELSRNC